MSFIPMYILGFMGASRRLDHYDASTGWRPLFITMLVGGLVIMAGIVLQIVQIIASFMQKGHLRVGNDPWDGRSLEWSQPSPPAFYNFVSIPEVKTRDAYWDIKNDKHVKVTYEDIHMPKPTAAGIYISLFATLASFAFVWHIIWLIVVSLIGIVVIFIGRGFKEDSEYVLPAAEVKKIEEARQKKFKASGPLPEHDKDLDMGLKEFVSIVFRFAVDIVRNKRWKT